jgi:hypothetical protein
MNSLHQQYLHICEMHQNRPNPSIEYSLKKSAGHHNESSGVVVIECASEATKLNDPDVTPVALLIKQNPQIYFRVRFPGQNLTCKSASLLASLLQVHSKILSLVLPFNLIKDEGAGALGATIATCQKIPETIDLTGNAITDHGLNLLVKGISIRPYDPSNSISLMVAGNHTSEFGVNNLADCLQKSSFRRITAYPLTTELKQAAFETRVEICNLFDSEVFVERLDKIEAACSFPQTQENRIKKLQSKISELEKSLVESKQNEQGLVQRIHSLEETVSKEQELCLKLLKQCQKIVN